MHANCRLMLGTAIVVMLGMLAGLGIMASRTPAHAASATGHSPKVCYIDGTPAPYTRFVLTRPVSLARFDRRHGAYASTTIAATALCGPGWQSLTFAGYVDAGNWHALIKASVRHPVVLWTLQSGPAGP